MRHVAAQPAGTLQETPATAPENDVYVAVTDSRSECNYFEVYTVGMYRHGLPELFMHHGVAHAASRVLIEVARLLRAGQLHGDILTFDWLTFADGEPGRFGIKRLQGAEMLAVADTIAMRYKHATGMDFNDIYTHGVWQIFTPDEDNILPWEHDKCYNLESAQSVAPAVIH